MMEVKRRSRTVAAAALILFFYALDQLTKWLVIHSQPFDSERVIVPGFFTLVYWGNTGAAFSSFNEKNGMFIVLSLVTLAVLGVLAMRGAFKHLAAQCAVSLLSAGVLGNVTDRIRHHYVVDFLLFDLHVPFAHPWPAFNVADSCICVAAVILVASSWMEERSGRKG